MRLSRPLNLTRVAHITAAWGVLFAVVHLYWAAGGEAGMNGEPADTPAAQGYIAFIALLGFAGAAVGHGFAGGRGARPRHRTLLLLARAGGLVLLLGVAVGTRRWLVDGSVEADGTAGIVITLYFLLGGLLFSTLGWKADGRSGGV
jgi:hypothetical protein